MVHALEEIHRLLRPTGVLIDIHAVAEPSPLEIHQGARIDLVGSVSVQQWCTDYEQADIALAEIVRRGLFAVERERLFDSPKHYDTVAELRAKLMEDLDRYARDTQSVDEAAPDAEALAARAEELMRAAASGAELVLSERVHISRLRPT